MGIRDEEIKRLTLYANGLGVKVNLVKSNNSDNDGDWALDGSEINIYYSSRTSKTDIILSLIHELGHHLYYIHEKNRKSDLKFEQAITLQNISEKDSSKITPRKYRKKIFDIEVASAAYWHIIYKDVALKIPEWKMAVQKELDIWIYRYYYESGDFPSLIKKNKKYKELLLKHKSKI